MILHNNIVYLYAIKRLGVLLVALLFSAHLAAQSPFPSSKQSLLLSNAQSGASERWAAIFFPSTATANYRLILPNVAPTVGQLMNVASISGSDYTMQWSDITSTAWGLSGNATTTAWNGTSGSFLGTTSAQPLSIATTNATAQDIRFYTGASGANERMRILSTGNVGIGTTTPAEQLTVTSNIGLTGASSKVIGSGGNLTMEQTGDQYGTTRLTLQNRVGVNGAMFEQAGSVDLVDFVFKGLANQRNIRYENRGISSFIAAPEFQIGTAGDPLTVVSDNIFGIRRGGSIRIYEPSVSGTNYTAIQVAAQTADITYTLPTTAPTAGQILSSDASGNMSWVANGSSSGWSITGNTSTSPATNYLGTTDAQAFVIRTNAVERARFANGNTLTFGIQGTGATAPPASYTIGSAGWTGASSTNNQVGTNLLIQAGSGTGSGTPGYISMQVPTAGASGTAVQSQSEMMRINSTGVLVGGASGTMPNYRLQVDANSGGQAYANFTTGSGSGTASTDGLLVGLQNDNVNALVWNQENGYLRFGTNNAERMRIDNAGNVGIGVTAPAELLDVAGDMRLTNQRTRSMQRTVPTTVGQAVDIGTFTLTNGGGSFWISVTVPSSNFSVSKQYLLPITWNQTNNVWFIAQPSQTTGSYGGNDFDLDVNISSASFSLRLRRSAGTTAGTAFIVIRQEGVNTDAFTASTTVNTVSAPSSTLYGSSGSSSSLSSITAATATNSINSANFAQTWQWNTLAGTSALTLSTTSTAAASNAQTLLNLSMSGANATSTQTTYGAQISNTHTGTSSTNVGLSVSASGGTNNYGLLVPNGNVGIGVSTPNAALQFGNVSTNRRIVLWETTNNDHQFYGLGINNNMLRYQISNTGATHAFFTGTSSSASNELMRIQGDGNVGIGTITPTYRLDVNGGDLRLVNNSSYLRTWGECDLEYDGGPDGFMAFRNNASTTGKTNFWNASSTNLLTIQNDGNIGINNNTPSQLLHTMNGNILIDNNDNTARELRFDEPSGGGTNYTAFRAQTQSANITYTLPASAPAANGNILSSTTGGTMSWTDLTTAVGGTRITYKTATETVTNSTTLQNDDHLFLSIGANEVWQYEFVVHVTGNPGSIKFAITTPASATMRFGCQMDNELSEDEYEQMTTSGTATSTWFNIVDSGTIFVIKGMVVNSTNAGNVRLQWAQNSGNGTGTTVQTLSYVKAHRVQ